MVLDLDTSTVLTIGVLGFSALNTYLHTRTQRDLTELKLFVFQNFVHRRDLAAARARVAESAPDALENVFS